MAGPGRRPALRAGGFHVNVGLNKDTFDAPVNWSDN